MWLHSRMYTYSVIARDDHSGEEVAIQFGNLSSVAPLLEGVLEELRRQKIPESDIARFVPLKFLGGDVVLPNCRPPAVTIHVGGQPVQGNHEPMEAAEVEVQENVSSAKVEVKDDKKSRCDICDSLLLTTNMARHRRTKHDPNPVLFKCDPPCTFEKFGIRKDQIRQHQATSACGR